MGQQIDICNLKEKDSTTEDQDQDRIEPTMSWSLLVELWFLFIKPYTHFQIYVGI